jgi:PP-loop superfamily ATP-utilizing enzyme
MLDMQRKLNLHGEMAKKLNEIGFKYVTLDLEGFGCKNMNEVLWTS